MASIPHLTLTFIIKKCYQRIADEGWDEHTFSDAVAMLTLLYQRLTKLQECDSKIQVFQKGILLVFIQILFK